MLHEGKMTSQEIAAFYEISYSTYRKNNRKSLCLADLHKYAEFEEVYGGVFITKVLRQQDFCDVIDYEKFFLDGFNKLPRTNEGEEFGTAYGIALRTIDEVNKARRAKGRKAILAETLAENYYSKIIERLYGKTTLKAHLFEQGYYTPEEVDAAKGEKGWRLSFKLIQIEKGKYRELTAEENELFKEIAKSRYLNKNIDQAIDEMEVISNIKNKLYGSLEEIQQELKHTENTFDKVRQDFTDRTGLILVSKGTKYKAADGFYYDYNENFRGAYDYCVEKSEQIDKEKEKPIEILDDKRV